MDDLKEFNTTERELQRILSYRKRKVSTIKRYFNDMTTFKFAVIGDTHLGSINEKLRELHTFYEICRQEGVELVLHTGDLLCGWRVYKGQEYEVRVMGLDNQVQYVIDHYPKLDAITTCFILGNHDESWFKLAGVDIGERISDKRPDMEYLGFYSEVVHINDVKVRLHHGGGSGTKTLSYKLQSYVNDMHDEDVFCLGHYHTYVYLNYKDTECLNAGCFEGESMFLKRHGLCPKVGGWICEVTIQNKKLTRFKPEFIKL